MNNRALDDDAEQADRNAGEKDRDPQADAGLGDDGAEIGAQHEEFALGEVDHAHHAENDGEPEADQNKQAEGNADLIGEYRDLIQRLPPEYSDLGGL